MAYPTAEPEDETGAGEAGENGPPQATGDLVPVEYSGLNQSASVPVCRLTKDDLRRLYNKLSEKAAAALDMHLEDLQQPPNQSEEQFEKLKEQAREVGGLTVVVQGTRGEQAASASDQPLGEEALPDKIDSVTFDSSVAMETYNVNIANKFRVQLDFTDPPGFQEYNPFNTPTPNESKVEVTGPNGTWVTGVYEWIQAFMKHRKRNWGWLHSATTFNLAYWLFGFPAALWVAYRVDSVWLATLEGLPGGLRGAIDVYAFLLGALAFRGVLYGLRWLFPLVELEESRSTGLRTTLGAVLVGILSALIYDVLRVGLFA